MGGKTPSRCGEELPPQWGPCAGTSPGRQRRLFTGKGTLKRAQGLWGGDSEADELRVSLRAPVMEEERAMGTPPSSTWERAVSRGRVPEPGTHLQEGAGHGPHTESRAPGAVPAAFPAAPGRSPRSLPIPVPVPVPVPHPPPRSRPRHLRAGAGARRPLPRGGCAEAPAPP